MLDLHFVAQHIQDSELRALTIHALDHADPEFWRAPASSTGKYHPYYDQGCMGLVRHTAVVAVMAVDALRRYYPVDEKRGLAIPRQMVDVVLCAGLLHDLCKNGYPKWGPHTLKDHPEITAARVVQYKDRLTSPESKMLLGQVCYAIQWHYGVWTIPRGRRPENFVVEPSDGLMWWGGEYEVTALCIQEADYHSSRPYAGVPDRERMTQTLAPYMPGPEV